MTSEHYAQLGAYDTQRHNVHVGEVYQVVQIDKGNRKGRYAIILKRIAKMDQEVKVVD